MLQADYCDLNCCCDLDCNDENKMVFTYCMEESNFIRDTRFCEYVDYIYKNNTLYEWDVNQNGLFCIVKYNLPKIYTIQKQQVRFLIENNRKLKKYYCRKLKRQRRL